MNLLNESKNLIENLEKIKENLGLNKPTGPLFKELEVRKKSVQQEKIDISKQDTLSKIAHNKNKKNYFRVTYMKSVIQFLDIKTILDISILNKEFHFFIKSVYFYKFINDAITSNKKRKILKKNSTTSVTSTTSGASSKTNPEKKGDYNFFGKITGAFSYLGK